MWAASDPCVTKKWGELGDSSGLLPTAKILFNSSQCGLTSTHLAIAERSLPQLCLHRLIALGRYFAFDFNPSPLKRVNCFVTVGFDEPHKFSTASPSVSHRSRLGLVSFRCK